MKEFLIRTFGSLTAALVVLVIVAFVLAYAIRNFISSRQLIASNAAIEAARARIDAAQAAGGIGDPADFAIVGIGPIYEAQGARN